MRGGGLRRRGIIIRELLFRRVLLDLHRGEFEFCSREGLVQGGTGVLEVLGTVDGISI